MDYAATRGTRYTAQSGKGTAPMRDGSYSAEQLERFFQDLWHEPAWRGEAAIDAAYYDGDQYRQDTLRKMKEHGIMPATVNLSAPAVDAVSGLEILTRTGLRCVTPNDQDFDAALAANTKFQEVMKQGNFQEMVGEQFKECVTTGISWLEVSRQPDPFLYPYRVLKPPWREMYVDYRAREKDYSDARYKVRRQWYDQDVLEKHFRGNKLRSLIRSAGRQTGLYGEDWISRFDSGIDGAAGSLSSGQDKEGRWTLEEDEWRNNERGRVGVIEILYFVPQEVEVLRLKTGHVIQLDMQSEAQLELLRTGQAKYARGTTKIWRQGYYIGPERLADRTLPTNMPHYIPMVCYRKDDNGAPYGVMRRMRSPQENINARYTRVLWDLQSRNYFIDEDAVDDPKEAAKELNKTTSFITLKAERQYPDGIRKEPGVETTQFSFQMMQEGKANMYDVTGLSPEFLSRLQTAGQSGAAIDSLIEQSTNVLAPILENYRRAKKKAAQQLFRLMWTDMAGEQDAPVDVRDDATGESRRILLNTRGGDGKLTNDLLMARLEIQLEKTPNSETYRQHRFQTLVEIVKSMPPELQGPLTPLIVRAAQIPDSEEILDTIRNATGFGPEPKDPRKREQLAQQRQEQQALEQQVQALEMAKQEADVAFQQAKAAMEKVKALKMATADTDLTEAKTMLELARANEIPDEQDRKEKETDAKMLEASARLRQAKQNPQPSGGDSAKK